MNKYGAVKTVVDGITFHSKKEADRYCEMKLLVRAGEISELELQPAFRCVVNGALICTYFADFRYLDCRHGRVVEDVKSESTSKDKVYRLKKKLVEALYNITITET